VVVGERGMDQSNSFLSLFIIKQEMSLAVKIMDSFIFEEYTIIIAMEYLEF
jgi:hypothetical protein